MLATSGHRVTEARGPRTPRWSSGGGLTPSTDSQNEPKSKKAILNRVGLIPSLPSARWCFNSLHPMGSGLDPIQLDVSKDSTFLPTQITELNAEEARYVTSHLHIKYNLIGEAIAALYKYFFFFFFYRNANQQSTKSGPNFSVHTKAERETLQPDALKLSRFRSCHPTRNIPSSEKLFLIICLVNELCLSAHWFIKTPQNISAHTINAERIFFWIVPKKSAYNYWYYNYR